MEPFLPNLALQVYAKNRGVETHGESAWIFFVEGWSFAMWFRKKCFWKKKYPLVLNHFKNSKSSSVHWFRDITVMRNYSHNPHFWTSFMIPAPSKPQDLTAALDGQGNIELKWKWEKPSASYTELSHFEIRATVVESKQAGLLAGTPFFFNHTVQQKKKSSYTRELSSLPISTLFQISVVAVNVNNFKSSPAKTNASTKGKLAFKTGEEVNIKPNKENGTWIDLKIPTVENTSNNTWINIIVKGPVTCLDNNSKPSKAKEWNVTSYRVSLSLTTTSSPRSPCLYLRLCFFSGCWKSTQIHNNRSWLHQRHIKLQTSTRKKVQSWGCCKGRNLQRDRQ